MVTKDEAFSLIKNFVAMANKQFGKTIKVIRTDNPLELGESSDALKVFSKVLR